MIYYSDNEMRLRDQKEGRAIPLVAEHFLII